MKYEEYILNELVDRFERSAVYRGDNKLNRGVYFEYNKQNVPDYFKDYTSKFKEAVNAASVHLENLCFIKIYWMKHEKGNVIQKVSLNIDKAEDIYVFLDRKPRKSKESCIVELARKYMTNAEDWADEFYKQLISSVEKGKDMALYIDISDQILTENIFRCVNAISVLEEEIPARVFSIRVLGKSKEFEKIKGRVAKIVRDFMKIEGLEQEEDILSACGVVNNPSNVFFSGPLDVLLNSGHIDFSIFKGGVGISPQTVNGMEVSAVRFKRIITIENLTSYYEFVRKSDSDSLVMYTGGYPGMVQVQFLNKLADYIMKHGSGVVFYHWGDIDFGGLSIFVRLKKQVRLDVRPLMMDIECLQKYKVCCVSMEHGYRNRLEELLKDDGYYGFHKLIAYMLEHNIRLEQECIDINDVLHSPVLNF